MPENASEYLVPTLQCGHSIIQVNIFLVCTSEDILNSYDVMMTNYFCFPNGWKLFVKYLDLSQESVIRLVWFGPRNSTSILYKCLKWASFVECGEVDTQNLISLEWGINAIFRTPYRIFYKHH